MSGWRAILPDAARGPPVWQWWVKQFAMQYHTGCQWYTSMVSLFYVVNTQAVILHCHYFFHVISKVPIFSLWLCAGVMNSSIFCIWSNCWNPLGQYATKGKTIIILTFLSPKECYIKGNKMAACVSTHYAVLWLPTLHLTTTTTTTTIQLCAGTLWYRPGACVAPVAASGSSVTPESPAVKTF